MTTTELIEALKPFGPNAKVIIKGQHGESEEFELSHLNPGSECRIIGDFMDPDIQKQNSDLETEVEVQRERAEKSEEKAGAFAAKLEKIRGVLS